MLRYCFTMSHVTMSPSMHTTCDPKLTLSFPYSCSPMFFIPRGETKDPTSMGRQRRMETIFRIGYHIFLGLVVRMGFKIGPSLFSVCVLISIWILSTINTKGRMTYSKFIKSITLEPKQLNFLDSISDRRFLEPYSCTIPNNNPIQIKNVLQYIWFSLFTAIQKFRQIWLQLYVHVITINRITSDLWYLNWTHCIAIQTHSVFFIIRWWNVDSNHHHAVSVHNPMLESGLVLLGWTVGSYAKSSRKRKNQSM